MSKNMTTPGSKIIDDSLIDELNSRVKSIENEIDMRDYSLIAAIHNHRDECKKRLDKLKHDFINENTKRLSKMNQILTDSSANQIQDYSKYCELQLNDLRENLRKLRFESSEFILRKDDFGAIKDNNNDNNEDWLNHSAILNNEEHKSLIEITGSTKGVLLYRASRDGFTADAFHSRCDEKENTITIVLNNSKCVFGGYASASWNSFGGYIYDPKAYIYSLRANGISHKYKFMVKNAQKALYGNLDYGPTFGNDIDICNKSNVLHSCSNFGDSYNVPELNSNIYLGLQKWLTIEIEVFQIKLTED